MNQYLLEKSRVPTVGEGERNYHSFYHLVAGGGAESKDLGLAGGPKGFHYLNQSSVTTIDKMPDVRRHAPGPTGAAPRADRRAAPRPAPSRRSTCSQS